MDKSFFPKALTALFFLLFVGAVYADSLDEEEARYAAAQFFNPSSQSSRLRAKGLQFELRSNGHEDGYYIFDRPEGGTVFVADDDAIGYTVLGYTDEDSFDVENLPIGLQDWLEQVGVLMDAVHEGKINRANAPKKSRDIVVDALIKTTWNQGVPFNNLCPMLDGKRCITGCVATAMAQVMKYWRWPNHGYGSVTYTDTYGCKQELSQNLSANNYNWDNMLDTYTAGNYSTAQANAVATLMRDCGYAVHMQYAPDASSANVDPLIMANYFHYSSAAKERFSYAYPEEMWHEFIRQDLLAQRPVLYSGRNDDDGGHQFILDGFDTSGYYHVNWGWGGNKDGWFILTNLNGYNDKQYMINELKPDKRSDDVFSYTLSSGVLTINGSGIMPQTYDLDHAPWKENCKNIRKIIIGEGITDIPSYFGSGLETGNQYTNLEELVLPRGLKSIGEGAFQGSGLTSVQLPSTLVSMDNAFWASNIKSLHLPKSLTCYIDLLPYLEELTMDEENPNLCVEDNVLYTKDCKNLLFVSGGLSRITVAETTEGVYDYNLLRLGVPILFKGKKAPSMPRSVLEYPNYYIENNGYLFIPIGSNGYESWKKVLPSGWTVLNYTDIDHVPDTKITWALNGSTLTIRGWGVQKYDEYGYDDAPYFSKRNAIRNIIVEEGVIGLCWAAYYGYYLEEAVLPSTLKFIDGYCFAYSDLTSITCYAKQAPVLGNNDVFKAMPTFGTLRVPEGANYSKWLNALPSGWKIEYFTHDALATCYFYDGEQKEVGSLQEWDNLLVQYPNTIGIIKPGKEEWAYLTCNMLFEDATTGRYQCPYLQLTDLTRGFSTTAKIPLTGFVPPVSFDVSKGTFSRKWNRGYNTCCLPFAVSEEELPNDCQMFAYSHFDKDKGDVIFNPQASSEAGSPFFVNSETIVEWQADLSGKTIVTQQQTPEANSNVRGTFVTTDAYQRIGYSPRVKDNLFAPLARYLHPFRACILINGSDAPAEVRVRLMDGDDADYLKGIMASPASDSPFIYTLDGKRLSSPIKGQPYIENGKIVIR